MKKFRIIALLAACVVFFFGYQFISGMNEKDGSAGGKTSKNVAQSISVVVAAQDIEPYTVLTSDMLTAKSMAIDEEMSGYYTSAEDVVGQICTSKIYSGELLTANRITTSEDWFGLSMKLEEGKRAMTVSVNVEQGVGNNLRIGNYVDIIVVSQLDSKNAYDDIPTAGLAFKEIFNSVGPENTHVIHENIDNSFSLIALQNIKVVALDATYISDTVNNTATQYSSVTLEVTPEEAAQIALLKNENASIQLILRPQNDEGTVHNRMKNILQPYTGQ